MSRTPIPLLACGYGLALAGAGAGVATGALGLAGAALTVWLGGALTCIALAVVLQASGAAVAVEDAVDADDPAAFAEALRRWEEDRHADGSAAATELADRKRAQ